MAVAYLDSSCIVAMAFGEPSARRIQAAIARHDRCVASNLVEAEVMAALVREQVPPPADLFDGLDWVHPNRAMSEELTRVLAKGSLRGADLWHVACALFLDPTAAELTFLTLDLEQRRVAAAVGFQTR